MKTDKGQELFKQRFNTVEAPFETLIFNFGMNKLMTKELEHTEEILTIFSTTYNLERIYNTIKKRNKRN